MKSKVLVSVIIPCFNEEENVDETYRQIAQISKKIPNYSFELIFIDNGSVDSTRSHIEKITEKDPRAVGIALSRNFGVEASVLAGYEYSKGDVILSCVCDLQDPLELIPEYLRRWERGFDIVIGIYTKTQDTPVMGVIRRVYYKIFKSVADIDIPTNSSGICLYSRKAIDSFISLRERFRSNIGLRAWIGFKTDYITYERRDRLHGKSSYNLFRYLKTAERGFFGFSYLPLDSIIYLGLFFFVLSFGYLFFYLVSSVFHITPWNGTNIIIASIVFFGAVQLLAISAIGKYIQVIVEETKHRPHYIIDTIIKRKESTKRTQ